MVISWWRPYRACFFLFFLDFSLFSSFSVRTIRSSDRNKFKSFLVHYLPYGILPGLQRANPSGSAPVSGRAGTEPGVRQPQARAPPAPARDRAPFLCSQRLRAPLWPHRAHRPRRQRARVPPPHGRVLRQFPGHQPKSKLSSPSTWNAVTGGWKSAFPQAVWNSRRGLARGVRSPAGCGDRHQPRPGLQPPLGGVTTS